jgi:thymidylate synthase (FAD)
MKNRHGTPFEHAAMTFYIEAPIFVFREFHRHRIGWSYNEVSGRYRELDPVFYVPHSERPLMQIGKPGHYEFVAGSDDLFRLMEDCHRSTCEDAYTYYKMMLDKGVAKEVARMSLPVGIYSAMYATCNPRSLMSFLSLRTKHEDSTFPSYPMREIEMVAEQMEWLFSHHFPLTYQSFCENGRVAP